MATKKPKTILFRRHRNGKTNYHRRLKTLMSGKPRLVVRMTNQKYIAQIITFEESGDKVITATNSFALKKLGWKYSCKNTSAAYLTGLLMAKLSLEKGVKEAIFDTGLKTPLHKGKLYAFLKGAIDGGLNIPHSGEEIFPSEDRINSEHIKKYAESLKSNEESYKLKFGKYLKNNTAPENISSNISEVKQKIIG